MRLGDSSVNAKSSGVQVRRSSCCVPVSPSPQEMFGDRNHPVVQNCYLLSAVPQHLLSPSQVSSDQAGLSANLALFPIFILPVPSFISMAQDSACHLARPGILNQSVPKDLPAPRLPVGPVPLAVPAAPPGLTPPSRPPPPPALSSPVPAPSPSPDGNHESCFPFTC